MTQLACNRHMNYFETILIPVDFSGNTQVAIRKAVELATPGYSVLHLFHVSPSGLFNSLSGAGLITSLKAGARNSSEEKLVQLKHQIQSDYQDLHVEISITSANNIENSVIAFAKQIKPSLVVIAKSRYHSFFPFFKTIMSMNVAEEANCAVLTVKPGSLKKLISTVVMPVADFYPKRKIEVISSLCSRIALNVHLLTILQSDQHPDNHSASALLQAMRSLRSKFQCNVQHSVIHSDDRAMATLRYAEKISADMILVNSKSEAVIKTWISKKDITDILNPASHLQVLSVEPYETK